MRDNKWFSPPGKTLVTFSELEGSILTEIAVPCSSLDLPLRITFPIGPQRVDQCVNRLSKLQLNQQNLQKIFFKFFG